MDPLIGKAACTIGLTKERLFSLLPSELTMWVDPYEVSYRIGEDGSICVLYESTPPSDTNQTDSCKDELRIGQPSPSKSFGMMTCSSWRMMLSNELLWVNQTLLTFDFFLNLVVFFRQIFFLNQWWNLHPIDLMVKTDVFWLNVSFKLPVQSCLICFFFKFLLKGFLWISIKMSFVFIPCNYT